jgi:hypothetical protein
MCMCVYVCVCVRERERECRCRVPVSCNKLCQTDMKCLYMYVCLNVCMYVCMHACMYVPTKCVGGIKGYVRLEQILCVCVREREWVYKREI